MTGKVIIRQKHLQKLRDRREALREEKQTQKRDKAIARERMSKRISDVRKLPPVEWTKEFTIEFFQQFESIADVRAAMRGPMAYEVARTNGWLNDCCRHMFSKPHGYDWTLEELKERAEPYSNRSHFYGNDTRACNAAKKMGVIDELFPKNTIDKETCRASALRYQRRGEWQKAEGSFYNYAQQNGLLDELCGHMDPVPERIKTRAKSGTWTREKCYESAKRFNSGADWERGDPKAFYAAVSRGWRAGIGKLLGWVGVEDRVPSGHWQDPLNCIIDARKYNTRAEWWNGNKSAARAASENGWMDMCCWHMEPGQQSDNDAIYFWEWVEDGEGTGIYKVGVTSWRLGEQRIKACASTNCIDYELIGMCQTSEGDATQFEKLILDMGDTVALPDHIVDGRTEFRIYSDEELDFIKTLMGVKEDAIAEAA